MVMAAALFSARGVETALLAWLQAQARSAL